MKQAQALDILKTGANVFLTGEPGSGKTYVVNQYAAWLRTCGIEPAITASTGIAATHIGGMTIHSWTGIGVAERLSPDDVRFLAARTRLAERLRRANVLIIDEISMLSAATLGMADAVCRAARGNDAPFGGLQTVLTGNLRFVGATLLHVLSSAVIGAAIGLSFYKKRSTKRLYTFVGVILAILLHSAFNFLILNTPEEHLLRTFGFVWIGLIALLAVLEYIKRIHPVVKQKLWRS